MINVGAKQSNSFQDVFRISISDLMSLDTPVSECINNISQIITELLIICKLYFWCGVMHRFTIYARFFPLRLYYIEFQSRIECWEPSEVDVIFSLASCLHPLSPEHYKQHCLHDNMVHIRVNPKQICQLLFVVRTRVSKTTGALRYLNRLLINFYGYCSCYLV